MIQIKKRIRSKIVMVLLLMVLFISLPVSAETLKGIRFSGNHHVPEKVLLENIEEINVGESFNEEKIKKDIKNIFDTGFFYEVNAEVANSEVIFKVKQNPVLTKVGIEGNYLINNAEIKQNIRTSKDRIYNEVRLKKDISKIYKLYEEKGYLGTQIKDISYEKDEKNTTEKADRGFLEIMLQEGYINNIEIIGLEETNKSIIEPLIEVNENEYLTVEKAEKTIKAIYNTEFFESVDLDTKLSENKDGIDVIFNVKEAKTGSYEVGLGYNEKKGTMIIGNIKEKNLFGTGKQIGLESDINELGYEMSGFYSDPYLPQNYEFDLSFDFGKEELIENKEEVNTDYQRVSSLLTKNSRYGSYFGGLKLENYKSNLDRNDHGRLVAINGGYYLDNTNKNLDPNKGQYLNLNVELAEELIGSEMNYNKFTGKYYQYFNGFKENHSLATKLVLGVGSEDLPYFKEYIASNSRHLKSYDFGDLRGDRMVVGSIEYRVPVWENRMILLGGFSFGDAWRSNERSNDIKTELVLGTKFSFAGMNNVRVDYAVNNDKEGKFQISMGNKF